MLVFWWGVFFLLLLVFFVVVVFFFFFLEVHLLLLQETTCSLFPITLKNHWSNLANLAVIAKSAVIADSKIQLCSSELSERLRLKHCFRERRCNKAELLLNTRKPQWEEKKIKIRNCFCCMKDCDQNFPFVRSEESDCTVQKDQRKSILTSSMAFRTTDLFSSWVLCLKNQNKPISHWKH